MAKLAIRQTLQRLKFSLSKYILNIVIFSIALAIVLLLGGKGQMSDEWRWGIAVVAAIIVTGLVLFLYEFIKILYKKHKGIPVEVQAGEYTYNQKRGQYREGEVVSELYRINPILHRMENCLFTLVRGEKTKDFDRERWFKINNEINAKILGITPSKTKTIRGARRVALRQENIVRGKFKNEAESIQQGLVMLTEISLILDSNGFGLKTQREEDNKYLDLNNQLEEIRNLAIISMDKELDALIENHVVYAEMIANMSLMKYRNMKFRAQVEDDEYSVTDFLSLPVQALTENFERNGKKFLRGIRTDISGHIRILEEGIKNE